MKKEENLRLLTGKLSLVMVQDVEIYHYHLDRLGTSRELINETGKLFWKAAIKLTVML